MTQPLLRYGYNGDVDNAEVHCVLQKIRNEHSPLSEFFPTKDAFLSCFPEYNCKSHLFQAKIFSRESYTNESQFQELVDATVKEMQTVANYLMEIRSIVPRSVSKKLYLGVVAELMGKKITPGGNASLFTRRCIVLFDCLIRGKRHTDCIGQYMLSIKRSDWKQVVQDLIDKPPTVDLPEKLSVDVIIARPLASRRSRRSVDGALQDAVKLPRITPTDELIDKQPAEDDDDESKSYDSAASLTSMFATDFLCIKPDSRSPSTDNELRSQEIKKETIDREGHGSTKDVQFTSEKTEHGVESGAEGSNRSDAKVVRKLCTEFNTVTI